MIQTARDLPEPDTERALDRLLASWARVGAFLTVSPFEDAVDLERLVVDTAHRVPDSERLFVVAASWLATHHVFVNGRRLVALARSLSASLNEPDQLTSAVLGAMLDVAITHAHSQRGAPPDALTAARAVCRPLRERGLAPRPLFRVMERIGPMRERARRAATPPFTAWGLWHDDRTVKPAAVRPVAWVLAHTPELRVRACLGATLEAELLWAAIEAGALRRPPADRPTVRSVAKSACASYAGTFEAAERLVRRGLLVRERVGVRQVLRPTQAVAFLHLHTRQQ